MELSQDVLTFVIVLCILIGTVLCFFGYRIFKITLRLLGFLFGGVLSGAIGYALSQNEIVALLTGLVGGFIGAALMVGLYFVGVFLLGALFGGVIGTVFYVASGNTPEPAVLLILIVIFGIIALIFQKFMIIVSTGFGGALGVIIGLAYFTTKTIDPTDFERMLRSIGSQMYAIILCWLALGIVGLIVQYRSVPKKNKLVFKEEKSSELSLE